MNKKNYEDIIEQYRNKLIEREEFDNRIKDVTNNLNSPMKEYYIINSYLYNNYYVPKDLRKYLYSNSLPILESDNILVNDKNKVKCALMNAYFADYNYEMSETYAKDLLNEFSNDIKVLRDLANYYTKTRRYDLADNVYKLIIKTDDNDLINNDYEEFQRIVNGIKNPYAPASNENKEKYYSFMNKLGIKIDSNHGKNSSRIKQPEKIKVGDYPIPIEHIQSDFDSFVAFDVETTGIDHSKDAITEIAAIKVVGGKIVEKKEFLFQELVHPYKKKIPKNVEELTGITNEMVAECRNIWEVFPDFAKFIENNVLVGYNCMTFDSKFLVRAGRLSNLIINNQYFDVMHLVKKYKKSLDTENMTLVQVGKALGIENPQAHRALADAITTAKIYLKIIELNKKGEC